MPLRAGSQQIREQAEEIGRLRAERAAIAEERDRLRDERADDRRLAGQPVDLLQVERDELRAEVDRLRAAADAPRTQPGPPGATGRPGPEPDASPAW